MFTEPPIDWNTGTKSSLLNIGTHSLHLSTAGPTRLPAQPLLILIPGLASSTQGYSTLLTLLTPFIRVLTYQRTGYPPSETSPNSVPPTASQAALELDLLLKKANLEPPYLIVVHSWGAIIAREFLEIRGKGEIEGIVFVEGNSERILEKADWRKVVGSKLLKGVDYFEGTEIVSTHKLGERGWKTFREVEENEEFKVQARLEEKEYEGSFKVLRAKRQLERDMPCLGGAPVCVVKGYNEGEFEKLLKKGLEMGNGDGEEEGEKEFRRMLDGWNEKDRDLQSEVLKLSKRSKFIETRNSGHFVHLTEPEVIVGAIKWVLEELNWREV